MRATRFYVLAAGLAMAGAPLAQSQKISSSEGGFTGTLDDDDRFGSGAASVGDLDGDGIGDVVFGAPEDDDGGAERGALWVLFLDSDGTVKSHTKVSDTAGGFTGTLVDGDRMGSSVAALGDLDGDGVVDVVAGAPGDDDGAGQIGGSLGALWVLFLNTDGTVKAHQKISATAGGFTGSLDDGDAVGSSVTALGDLDGDGVVDLAAGATGDDDGGGAFGENGAVWVLFLDTDGTVQSHQKISATQGGFGGSLPTLSFFGVSAAGLGDLDGDGAEDLVVGSSQACCGQVWILFLNTDGTVKAHQKIDESEGGFGGALDSGDNFGFATAACGDLDGDGVVDLAVGAPLDDDGGDSRGAVWVLHLDTDGTVSSHQKISDTAGAFALDLDDTDRFGSSLTCVDDLAPGTDLIVGTPFDDDGGADRGAAWVLHEEEPVELFSVTPAQGPFEGGNVVVLSGANFTPGTTVSFGTILSSSVTFVSPAELHAVAPPQPLPAVVPGPIRVAAFLVVVDVTVADGGGDMDTLPSAYTYAEFPVATGPQRLP